MRKRSNASSPVDVQAHVPLRCESRRARVKTHPHADRAVGQNLQRHPCRRRSSSRRRKRDEERISLRVDLDSAVRGDRITHNPPMIRERLRVITRPQLMQKPRRPLHVREEKSNGTGRQLTAHWPLIGRYLTR